MAMKTYLRLGFISLLLVCLHPANAACTYSEAMMAYKQGNDTRGLALMRMAANDGDARAARYLVKIDDKTVNPDMKQLIVADDKASTVPLVWEKLQNTAQ